MHAPGTSERKKGKLPGIIAPFHGNHPDSPLHGGIGHIQDPFGQFQRGQPHFLGHCFKMGGKPLWHQRHLAPKKMLGDQSPQIKICIGHRDAVTLPVTDGSGICTGTFRSDVEGAPLIQEGDGAPAGPHRMNIDHRYFHRITGYAGFEGHGKVPVYQGDIRRCAAHVEGNQFGVSAHLSDFIGPHRPAGRTRENCPYRFIHGRLR